MAASLLERIYGKKETLPTTRSSPPTLSRSPNGWWNAPVVDGVLLASLYNRVLWTANPAGANYDLRPSAATNRCALQVRLPSVSDSELVVVAAVAGINAARLITFSMTANGDSAVGGTASAWTNYGGFALTGTNTNAIVNAVVNATADSTGNVLEAWTSGGTATHSFVPVPLIVSPGRDVRLTLTNDTATATTDRFYTAIMYYEQPRNSATLDTRVKVG